MEITRASQTKGIKSITFSPQQVQAMEARCQTAPSSNLDACPSGTEAEDEGWLRYLDVKDVVAATRAAQTAVTELQQAEASRSSIRSSLRSLFRAGTPPPFSGPRQTVLTPQQLERFPGDYRPAGPVLRTLRVVGPQERPDTSSLVTQSLESNRSTYIVAPAEDRGRAVGQLHRVLLPAESRSSKSVREVVVRADGGITYTWHEGNQGG